MPRPRSITDDAIRHAARDVFVEHGPGASVSLVAERLGVSHAALFNRAGSKRQLMLDALCPDRPRAMRSFAEPPPATGADHRLVEILSELMAFFRRVVPNLVVLKAAGAAPDGSPDPDGPPPVALRRALTGWLEAAVTEGALAPMRCPAVAEGLLGAMEARCFNAYLGGPAFAPGDDATFLQALVDGLVTASGAGR